VRFAILLCADLVLAVCFENAFSPRAAYHFIPTPLFYCVSVTVHFLRAHKFSASTPCYFLFCILTRFFLLSLFSSLNLQRSVHVIIFLLQKSTTNKTKIKPRIWALCFVFVNVCFYLYYSLLSTIYFILLCFLFLAS
jgi:hypothetical protein